MIRSYTRTLQRIKGMPATSASLARNRHLASLATHLLSFYSNEETQASMSSLLSEMSGENANLAASIKGSRETVTDMFVSDILGVVSNTPPSTNASISSVLSSLSELWTSQNDASGHWVMVRLRRLQAVMHSSQSHIAIVDRDIPDAGAAFRKELAALSMVGMGSTITSACLEEYVTKYEEVAGRIAGLGEVLGRNAERLEAFCGMIREQMSAFGLPSLASSEAAASGISLDEACAALLEHVHRVVRQLKPARAAFVEDIVADLVDVGTDAYRSRQNAAMTDALGSSIDAVVNHYTNELLFSEPNRYGGECAYYDSSDEDGSGFAVVLRVPTLAEAVPSAQRILKEMATDIQLAVPEVILEFDVVDMISSEIIQNGAIHPAGQTVPVSKWLVVEIAEISGGTRSRSGSVQLLSTDSPPSISSRIESIVADARTLKSTILGYLQATKEELAPHVTTIVSDMQERAWLLDAEIDRLRYDCDVYNFLHGQEELVFDDSTLPVKGAHDGLVQALRSKVLKAEQALLDDYRTLEAQIAVLKSDMDWARNIQTYSTTELELKLGELGLTLDQCVEQAHVGARYVEVPRTGQLPPGVDA